MYSTIKNMQYCPFTDPVESFIKISCALFFDRPNDLTRGPEEEGVIATDVT